MKALDLTGENYGRWTVLGKAPGWSVKRPLWRCRCGCGTERDVLRNHLRSGHSQSCGCWKAEASSKRTSASLAGRVFGKLTVIERAGSLKTHDKRASSALWRCQCSCGKQAFTTSYKLTSGYKRSCGCLFLETVTKHGKTSRTSSLRTRVYTIWSKMRERCSERAEGRSRADYYERGIRVCERWQHFPNFLADMGEPSPDQTLDRINPNGNYEPGNCRWATRKEQARNTRRNKVVMVNGREMILADALALIRREAKPLHQRQ